MESWFFAVLSVMLMAGVALPMLLAAYVCDERWADTRCVRTRQR